MRRLSVFLALLLTVMVVGLQIVVAPLVEADVRPSALALTMTPSPRPTATPSIEAEIVLATLNGLRADVDIEPLAFDARLMTVADTLSRTMAESDDITPPTKDEFDQLLANQGYAFQDMYHAAVSYTWMDLDAPGYWWNPLDRLEQVLKREFVHAGIADVTTTSGRHYLNVILAQPIALPGLIGPEATSEAAIQEAEAEAIVRLLNEAREAEGVRPLEIDERLMEAALKHSEDMAARDELTHNGSHGNTVGQRVLANGYIYWSVGEVILVRDTPDAEAAFEQWWDSPEHRGVMLTTRAAHVGVGYARSETSGDYYYTMVVARH